MHGTSKNKKENSDVTNWCGAEGVPYETENSKHEGSHHQQYPNSSTVYNMEHCPTVYH